MRLPVIAAILASLATPAVAFEMPPRKPGLWELKMIMQGQTSPMQTFQHCIDAATDKQMSAMATGMTSQCAKQDVKQAGNTITVDSVCDMGLGKMASQAVITGDFSSAYTMTIHSKREGGPSIPGITTSETRRSIGRG